MTHISTMVKELVNFAARNSNVSAVAKLIMVILKGAKLVGAGGALASIDFVVRSLEHTINSLLRGLEVSESLEKSRLHPHFLGPFGALGNTIRI